MMKATPQQPTGKASRQPRSPNIACGKSADVCELLLAELRARHVRIQRLLHLVWMDAESLPARRAPVRTRATCGIGSFKRSA